MIRDLFRGMSRFCELLEGPEKIPTNILADRLRRLESAGLIDKRQYQERPKRFEYRLTTKGQALGPVLKEIARWGNAHYPGTVVLKKS